MRENNPRRRPPARHMDPYGERMDHGRREDRPEEESESGQIEGRNAVLEALRAGRPIDKLLVMKGDEDAALGHIIHMARDAGVAVVDTDRRKLDEISITDAHQGVIAVAAVKEYCTVEDILAAAEAAGEPPLIILCDEISDPHNLGAIIRTAECAGAHGVVIPRRRSAGITATVAKTSAGAVEYLPVAKVANLTNTIRELKDRGVWIYGTAAAADSDLYTVDLTGPSAIVIGSEGNGMSRLVAENCDIRMSIPMAGRISSLNASVSAAVVLYEAVRQRRSKAERRRP